MDAPCTIYIPHSILFIHRGVACQSFSGLPTPPHNISKDSEVNKTTKRRSDRKRVRQHRLNAAYTCDPFPGIMNRGVLFPDLERIGRQLRTAEGFWAENNGRNQSRAKTVGFRRNCEVKKVVVT